jgi:hypothetical protein
VELGLADPKLAAADTTAQEAAIPHPTEVGLLSSFLQSVGLETERPGSWRHSNGGCIHTAMPLDVFWLVALLSAEKWDARGTSEFVAFSTLLASGPNSPPSTGPSWKTEGCRGSPLGQGDTSTIGANPSEGPVKDARCQFAHCPAAFRSMQIV